MRKYVFEISAIFVFAIATISARAQNNRSTSKSKTVSSNGTKDMLSMLQGRWSSLDDKKTFFQIEGDKQIDIYGRDILDTAMINFYDDCPKRISAGDEKRRSGKYLIVEVRPNDFYCYSIDKISSQQLVLTYLPRGSILRYKKVPTIKLQARDDDDNEN